jgi:hypothetical protein
MKSIKKIALNIWQAWYEARLAYAKRYTNHPMGS